MINRDELVLNRQQSRMIDKVAIEQFGIHSLMLMENAGRQCVDCMMLNQLNGPVVIACGPGNNGGDGFVIARHLRIRGIATRVILIGSPSKLSGDALTNFEILKSTNCEIAQIETTGSLQDQRDLFACVDGQPAEWIVDAMLGTGGKGPARSPIREIIQLIHTVNCRILAVDIPSGMDCDEGVIDSKNTISATLNCTFVSKKPYHTFDSAKALCGSVKVLDIGLPDEVIRVVLDSQL